MRNESGFTLIELMIAVVVVAILTTIVYPSYQEHLVRGKLAEAPSGLSEMRMRAEQYFADNRTYTDFACTSPSQATYFQFTCDIPSAATYTLTATGIANKGTGGFVYTVNQANTRTSTTSWGDSTSCWVVKNGGGC